MRFRRLKPRLSPAFDVLVLVPLYVLDLLVSWNWGSSPPWLDPRVVPLLGLVVYLPLLWRRKRPLLVLSLTVLGSIIFAALVPPTVLMLGTFLGLYAAARYTKLRPAYAGLMMALVLVAVNVVAQLDYFPPDEAGQLILVGGLLGTMMTVAAFATGRWARSAARQRRMEAELAAADERSRIARDLHDVVAHSVSLMVLQAAGAGRLLESNPERARTALRHVDELGGQAVGELRRMLGLLVPSEPVDADAPASSRVSEVPLLAEELRATGRAVLLATDGEPAGLAPEADLAAYRIVQEALTNAAKYADPRRPVEVRLSWQENGLSLRIRTHGSTGAQRQLSTGHGIAGMRQRAERAGGTAEAGATPDGGYVVSAAFPALAPRTPSVSHRRWAVRATRAAGGHI